MPLLVFSAGLADIIEEVSHMISSAFFPSFIVLMIYTILFLPGFQAETSSNFQEHQGRL